MTSPIRRCPAALLAGLAACAVPEDAVPPAADPVPERAAPAPVHDPLALVPSSGGMGHQAALNGRLALEGGCLYVIRPNGERWIPVFRSPHTRWNAEAQAVDTAWGSRFRVGEPVRLAGGVSRPQSWSKPPPAGCADGPFWLVTEPMVLRPAWPRD